MAELPILSYTSLHEELLMSKAHRQDQKGARVTLWRSRTKAWIWRGPILVATVARSSLLCRAKQAKLTEQRMGDLPEEKVTVDSEPFFYVCLDLMGPMVVKSMTNKRAQMNVWPILSTDTPSIHTQVAHNYGTDAFLQYDHFTAIRDLFQKVVSDQGSE